MKVEAADLIAWAEAILSSANQPEPRMALAFELQDDIDEMLEKTWTCDRTILRHMTDKDE